MSMWKNDLQRRSIEDYHRLRDRQFAFFEQQDGVLGYGTFGSIGAPGLSDLDLAVVVDDPQLQKRRFRLAAPAEIDSYLMTHAPLVLPRSLLPQLALYHPVQIEWAWTKETLEVPECTAKLTGLHLLRKTCHLMFHLHLLNKVASTRKAIMSLTSLLRSVEIAQRIGLHVSQEAQEYAQSVLSLRDSWTEGAKGGDELSCAFPALIAQARIQAPILLEEISLQLFGEEFGSRSEPGVRLQLTPLKLLHCVDAKLLREAASRADDSPSQAQEHAILRLMSARHIAVGPTAWAFFKLLASLETAKGDKRWPRLCAMSSHEEICDTLGNEMFDLLSRMFAANRSYARCLYHAGLPQAYFGSYWRLPLKQSLLFCALAHLQRLVSRQRDPNQSGV